MNNKKKVITIADISTVAANLEIGKETTFQDEIHIHRKSGIEWRITKIQNDDTTPESSIRAHS